MDEANMKKRGRPSKNREESNVVLVEKNVENKIKKRGRKPKDKLIESTRVESDNDVEEKNSTYETIILHIPYKIEENNSKYLDSVFTNKIFDKEILEYDNLVGTEFPKPTKSLFMSNNEMLHFENVEGIFDTENNSKILNKEITEDDIVQNKNGAKKKKVEEIEANERTSPISTEITKKKTLSNLFKQFCHCESYPEKTDICCWWCCHKFNTIPISLPYKYDNGKFHSYGVFCSFNCAAAYNFSSDDYNNNERYMLLNLLYKKITNSNEMVKIKMSPPKELLRSFGGHLDIDEYRKNSITNEKSYKITMPPIISILPQIEENINYLGNNKSDLRLKRSKPIEGKTKGVNEYFCT